jgi:Bacterial protein of unknown function (DUF853)
MATDTADPAARIAAGYQFAGPAVDLGSVVIDSTAHPDATVRIPLGMVNRHGLVAGATGTGKTKTLQLISEQLPAAGVPVFLADIKGDLSGLAAPGQPSDKITVRAADTGDDWRATSYPVEFLALGGIGVGIPVRATITSFGPILLSKVLGLNETQESSLGLVFHFADKAGLPLLDLKDLRAVIQYLVSTEGKAALEELGGLSKATAGVILRELIALADQGGDVFFGEPEFDTADLLRTALDGRGVLSAVELAGLQDRPALFSTFMMWLLADLFAALPEVGDPDKPKLVFFFDEAHLLFADASKAFLQAVTQTVRLIRCRPHLPRHRRGGGHRALRARRADAGSLDHGPGAPLADGPDRAGRAAGGGRRLAAEGRVRNAGGPRLGVRTARREAGSAGDCIDPRRATRAASPGTRPDGRRRDRRRPRLVRVPLVRPIRCQRPRPGDHPGHVWRGPPQAPLIGSLRADAGSPSPSARSVTL